MVIFIAYEEDADCFGSYYNDSCTICDNDQGGSGKCKKPECGSICQSGFSCSSSDLCTMCDPATTLCKMPACGGVCTTDAECKGTGTCTKCAELGGESFASFFLRFAIGYFFLFP